MNALIPVLQSFASLLAERLANQIYTTEDSLRYLLFHSLVADGGVHPNRITLEEPLPPESGEGRVDTVVYNAEGRRTLAMEFKYHRTSTRNQPTPQQAGDLFRDLFRLAALNASWACDGCFVYVTDRGMGDYLSQARHGLHDFFALPEGAGLPIGTATLAGRNKTFLGRAGSAAPAMLTALLSRDLPADHALRVYAVRPPVPTPSTSSGA